MKFLTFVEVDLRKIIPFLIGLYIVAILGFQGLFFNGVSNVNQELTQEAMNNGVMMDEYVKTIDPFSLTTLFDRNPLPVLFAILMGLALVLIGFYLWYKEWFGASKRIYTLLSIRGSRMRIFASKLTAFMFAFTAYFGIVLLNLYLAGVMANAVLPDGAVADNLLQNAIMHSVVVSFIIPNSVGALLYQLAFIVMIFTILSVFVLLDRSKRIWGFVSGLVYIIASMALFIYMNTLDLFTDERFYANWAFTGAFIVISTLVSHYLINKKVSI